MNNPLITCVIFGLALLTGGIQSCRHAESRSEAVLSRYSIKNPDDVDSLYGFKDASGTVVIKPQFRTAHDFHEGFSVVEDISGKWGYLKLDGSYLVKPCYDGAWPFQSGCAIVSNGAKEPWRINTQGLFGLIDQTGELILPIEYSCIGHIFSSGLATISKGKRCFNPETGLFCVGQCGFVNSKGEVIVPLIYEQTTHFVSGVAGVRKEGKWGLIDSLGNVIEPLKYDSVSVDSKGRFSLLENGRWRARNENERDRFFSLTSNLIFNGKTELAMRNIDSALKVNPRNTDAIRLKINVYQRTKNIAGIKNQVDILLAVDTVSKRGYNIIRGAIEEYTNSFKAALPYYEKAKTAKVRLVSAEYKDTNPVLIDYLIDDNKQQLKKRLVDLFGKDEWEKRLEYHWLVDYSRKEVLEMIIGIQKTEVFP